MGISPQTLMLGQEPRQTTSNLGHLNKPSIQALIHGLNRHYYSIAINYRKNELEEKMLLNLNKKADLAKSYVKSIEEEQETPIEKRAVANVGKQDAKKHLEASLNDLMGENIIQCLGTMLDTVAF